MKKISILCLVFLISACSNINMLTEKEQMKELVYTMKLKGIDSIFGLKADPEVQSCQGSATFNITSFGENTCSVRLDVEENGVIVKTSNASAPGNYTIGGLLCGCGVFNYSLNITSIACNSSLPVPPVGTTSGVTNVTCCDKQINPSEIKPF